MKILYNPSSRLTYLFVLKMLLASFTSLAQVPGIPFLEEIKAKPAELYNRSVPESSSVESITCNTSTFRISLTAGNNEKILIKEVETLSDGNFLLAGNILLPGPAEEGLLCIINNAGVMQSQKRITINSSPTFIYACETRYDGSIFIAGTVVEGTVNKIFVSKLNGDLSPVWTTLTEAGQLPSKVVLQVNTNEDVITAAQLPTGIIYALINPAGIIQWQKQCAPSGIEMLAGAWQNDFGQMGLVINATRTGRKITEIVTIDRGSGSVLTSHTLGDGTEEYVFNKVTSFFSRGIFTGVVKNSSSQFKLTRQILFNSGTSETVHTYDVPLPVGFDCSSAQDNAGDALGFCFPQQGKLLYIRHYAYYQTWPEYFRSYDVPVGSNLVGVSRSLVDGGYLFGLNTFAQDSIVLLKTDSIGILAGCGYTTLNSSFTETLNIQNTISVLATATNSIAATTGMLVVNNAALNTEIDCNEIYCPPPPPADTCLSTYYRTYRSNSHFDVFTKYHLMRNNNHLAQTVRYDRALEDVYRVNHGLKLFSERGDFIKGVNIFINGKADPVISKRMDDRHIMLVHRSLSSTNPTTPIFTFTLVNDSLNIVWSKSTETYVNFFSGVVVFGDLTMDAEGNYYYVYNSSGIFENAKLMVYKMDANGNQAWLKIFSLGAQGLGTSAVVTTNNTVVVQLQGSAQGTVSVSLDKATGQFISGYQYTLNFGGAVGVSRIAHHNGYVFTTGAHYENFQTTLHFGLLDSTGKPLRMKEIPVIAAPNCIDVKFGKLYAVFDYYNGTVFKKSILRMDTTLTPDFITEFFDSKGGGPLGMGVADNGAIYTGGVFYYGGVNSSYADNFIRKTDSIGGSGTCPSEPSPLSISDFPFTFSTITAIPLNHSFTPVTIPVVLTADTAGPRIAEQLCSSTPLCTSIQLTGSQAVCQLNQPFTYLAQSNSGCNLRPVWVYDTAFATLQTVTDTSAVFIFKAVGITKLYVKLNTGCSFYTDSIEVNIQNAPAIFSLGADASLCPGDSLLLNAGAGFNSYLWQNGSTDSTFIVSSPGQYYVQTSNLCGNIYADTIHISAVIIPPLNIGPNATVCLQDTVHLQAGPGFVTYNWFPAGTVTANGQQAYVIPTSDMQVWVSAVTSESCVKSDTLAITVISAAPVFLGMDTSFCINDSIILSAGTGYQHYLWSDGSAASSIVVKQAGTYWVKAIATNGCSTTDTMRVLQTYSLPQPSLGNDFTLCTGTQRQLNAGNFNSFLWQDGSNLGFYTVTTPGTYHVMVTDNNQCSASDTVTLLQLLPSPADFLVAADSVCEFSSINLIPLSDFNAYQWSTGATQKIITVSAPGQYVLTATNNNGCSGKDTISVAQKNCYGELYVPSAFTPNNDGLNDLFKPIVPGNVLQYSFEVYDRAGQRVFATINPAEGWRGDVSGVMQSSGIYVWHCRYQLPGKAPGYQKGTVALIR